ncbi:sensor histidine kinase [Kitasatospora sp. NPDC001664]|uniref:sensor histidine kinase n=1 Tax=Kitasatospora albolonga TaxID=68173 RepID=UPI0035E8A384
MKRPGRPGRLPLRGRLALVTTGVFAVLGCGMLALNLLSARQLIQANRDLLRPLPLEPATPVVPSPETGFPAPEGGVPTSGSSTPAALTTPAQGFDDFRNTILSDLLTRSLLLLAVFTLLAALLAWWAGRRSLARLHQVTATARRISADRSLDERLALDGPYDEIRELGDTFDAMLDRLGRAFTAQRRFTALASHELRTPLTVQRTALEIPLAQGRVPDGLRPAVERALAANARTESLISALLTLARGESGTLHPRRTDLADAASAAARELAEEAGTAGVALTVSPDPAPLEGDPELLHQLVLNLLANAVRHNHPGGTAELRTGSADGAALLTVTNSGPVLDPEEVPALFTPFHRGRARAQGSGGSGLGLAVVEAVTTAHGGTVTATARPGGGLTVRVRLPS